MIARAAEQDALWPHLVALGWQALWVALILKFAAAMFRSSVLKSGPSRRWPWRDAEGRQALTDRRLRRFGELRHQRLVRERAVADPRDPGAGPFGLRRRAGISDRVDRQRHRLDDPLDQPEVAQPGNEEAARPGVGEGLAALDRFVGQRRVMLVGLTLRNRSVRALMKKSSPTARRAAAIRRPCSSSG